MKNYLVGYGRVDVTPLEPMPQAGFGNTDRHIFKVVRDPICASCFAITDEMDTTILLICVDLQRADIVTVENARENIARELGIPGERVMVCATHTHSGPEMFRPELSEATQRYRPRLDAGILQAARLALYDRSEARMFMGDVEALNMNFVKHYCHTTPEGETRYFGDIFGTEVLDETTRHVSQADPTMHIVKFVREGRKDLVLVNWRAHGHICSAKDKFDLSADFVGCLRTAFEEKTDALITYFQGACGNVNPRSRLRHEEITRDPIAYGNRLADYVLEGLENLTEVTPAPIQVMRNVLMEPINKPTPEFLEDCLRVQKLWRETNDAAACRKMGQPLGIRSHAMANAVITRNKRPDISPIELNAITFGELAIVTAPNELFDTLSVYVEDHAPYQKVLTFGYANHSQGYIPSAYGFEYSCYESDCCYFKPGIGEKIRDTFLEMLNTLKADKE